ncbi:MAG: hypothetical protein DSY91_06920 [Deltaproteobacteria bacterium]|nr:MAG: hypothetical protein DSY91_06920 [Deltaproteobacteria bacterium]
MKSVTWAQIPWCGTPRAGASSGETVTTGIFRARACSRSFSIRLEGLFLAMTNNVLSREGASRRRISTGWIPATRFMTSGPPVG